jgi:hypothetical protein
LAVTKKTVGDGEKLLTYLNSALKFLLGTDIFLRVPKTSYIFSPSEICKYTHFFPFNLAVTKKPWMMEKNYLHI